MCVSGLWQSHKEEQYISSRELFPDKGIPTSGVKALLGMTTGI